MDNYVQTILSDDSESDSESSDRSVEFMTSNVGVMYDYRGSHERMLDEKTAQHYIDNRNKYFTPELLHHTLSVTDVDASDKKVDLTKFGLDLRRVIGFKLVKAVFQLSDANQGGYIDIVSNEIPYIACIKNSEGKHLIQRVQMSTTNTFLYYENKHMYREIYFTPIELSVIHLTCLSSDNSPCENAHLEFEVTVLNTNE